MSHAGKHVAPDERELGGHLWAIAVKFRCPGPRSAAASGRGWKAARTSSWAVPRAPTPEGRASPPASPARRRRAAPPAPPPASGRPQTGAAPPRLDEVIHPLRLDAGGQSLVLPAPLAALRGGEARASRSPAPGGAAAGRLRRPGPAPPGPPASTRRRPTSGSPSSSKSPSSACRVEAKVVSSWKGLSPCPGRSTTRAEANGARRSRRWAKLFRLPVKPCRRRSGGPSPSQRS